MKKNNKIWLIIFGVFTMMVVSNACTDPAFGSINNNVPVFGTYGIVNIGSDHFDLQWPVLEDETGQRIELGTEAAIIRSAEYGSNEQFFSLPTVDLVTRWDYYQGQGYAVTLLASDAQTKEVSGVYVGGADNFLQESTPSGPAGTIEYRRIGNLLPDTWYTVTVVTRLLYDHWGYIARPIQFLVHTLP